MKPPAHARIYRYAPLDLVDAFLALGWMATDGLVGTHHGSWSVLVCFLCDCVPAVPVRE